MDGPEPTFFTKQEKEVICEVLSNYGLPILSGDSGNKVDYKSDFQFLRNKMLDRMKKIKAEEALRKEAEQEKEVVVEESKEAA